MARLSPVKHLNLPLVSKLISIQNNIKRTLFFLLLFICYDIFFVKSPQVFFSHIFGLRYFVNYIISLLGLTFFILIVDNLFQRKNWLVKLLAYTFVFVPLAIQTAHYSFYHLPLNTYGIRFFFHDTKETIHLGMENINGLKIFSFLVFSFFTTYLFVKNTNTTLEKNKFSITKLILYISFYIPIVVLCGINWYLILDYQNSMISVYASIPEAMRSFYFKELKANKPKISLEKTNKTLPNILWIIGESATKSHMSLYGYSRSTTPHLDVLAKERKLFAFNNVVSIGPHTIISVPYMMVGLQNIDPQGKIYSTPNVFEYAKARGYQTAFISSQDLRWRNFDQLVGGASVVDFFRSGPDFSSNVSVAKGADDLKVLKRSILPHLQSLEKPFLFVTHMDGSHYPYSSHSEPAYKKFLPEVNENGINAYDNTLVYSDVYLSTLISEARKKDPNIWIFYTTDHGQPVALPKDENSKILADQGPVLFNQGYDNDIIHNAFFVLPPADYISTIEKQVNKPVAQADIFATILDLMQIPRPVVPIDGISLLKNIPNNRLRVSTGFVTTNDNVPEAQVTYPDQSSAFIDFARNSVSFQGGKMVTPLDKAPREIQELFAKDHPHSH